MSMTSARHAAAEEAVIASNESDPREKKKAWWVRVIRICIPKTPKSADGWTNMMAILGAMMVPTWFMVAYWWNPGYEPQRAAVWVVPREITFWWLSIQLLFLSISMQKTTDEIRFREIIISVLPLLSCAITLSALFVLSTVDKYRFGGFQVYEMWAFITAAAFNAVIGGGVRFALKGKLFGQLGSLDNT